MTNIEAILADPERTRTVVTAAVDAFNRLETPAGPDSMIKPGSEWMTARDILRNALIDWKALAEKVSR